MNKYKVEEHFYENGFVRNSVIATYYYSTKDEALHCVFDRAMKLLEKLEPSEDYEFTISQLNNCATILKRGVYALRPFYLWSFEQEDSQDE